MIHNPLPICLIHTSRPPWIITYLRDGESLCAYLLYKTETDKETLSTVKKKKNVLLEEQKKIKCKKTVSLSGRRRVLRKVGELLPLHPGAQYV